MMAAKRYRRKPVVIEAIQLRIGIIAEEVKSFCPAARIAWWGEPAFLVTIPTLEGDMQARDGDWIIKGVAGEFYPCKPGIFKETYEAVE